MHGANNRGNIQSVPREVHLSHERESRENVKIVYRLKLSRFWTKPIQGRDKNEFRAEIMVTFSICRNRGQN